MLVDTALERAEAELFNAVSTSAWEPHSGECLALKSELSSAGFLCVDPLVEPVICLPALCALLAQHPAHKAGGLIKAPSSSTCLDLNLVKVLTIHSQQALTHFPYMPASPDLFPLYVASPDPFPLDAS